MPAIPEVAVDNTTGSTIAIASSNIRRELLLRCRGGRVWLGFNEAAVSNAGIWVNDGDGVVIAQPLCQSDIYMISDTTATVGVETVF